MGKRTRKKKGRNRAKDALGEMIAPTIALISQAVQARRRTRAERKAAKRAVQMSVRTRKRRKYRAAGGPAVLEGSDCFTSGGPFEEDTYVEQALFGWALPRSRDGTSNSA